MRTLHNPTGNGNNVVLVGGSDDEGVNKAATVFIETLNACEVKEGALRVGRNGGVRHLEDGLGAAIVALEQHLLGIRIISLEL